MNKATFPGFPMGKSSAIAFPPWLLQLVDPGLQNK